MQKERLAIKKDLTAVMADGPAGFIISTPPDKNKIIEIHPGEQILLKVDGEKLNTINSKCIWSVNWLGGARETVLEGKDKFVFRADRENGQSNRLTVTCGLYEYRFVRSYIPYHWEWVPVDVRSWKIRIIHDTAPVWRGNCYLEDIMDIRVLNGYTDITGSLRIGINIKSVKGLERLAAIGGDLVVLYNKCLKTLEGLENLASLGGNLDVWQNASLTGVTGLENLASVEGNLYISGNGALTSLDGIGNMTSVNGDLNIYNNAALTDLGMAGLQRIGGNFWINYNPLLSSLLAEELRDQVLARGGIGSEIIITSNKNC
jgi:hypothetical protein